MGTISDLPIERVDAVEVGPADILIFRFPGQLTREQTRIAQGMLRDWAENIGIDPKRVLVLENGTSIEVYLEQKGEA